MGVNKASEMKSYQMTTFVETSVTKGCEGKTGAAYAKQVFKNLGEIASTKLERLQHKILAHFGKGEWINNTTVLKKLNKEISDLNEGLGKEGVTAQQRRTALEEFGKMRDVISALEEGDLSEAQMRNLEALKIGIGITADSIKDLALASPALSAATATPTPPHTESLATATTTTTSSRYTEPLGGLPLAGVKENLESSRSSLSHLEKKQEMQVGDLQASKSEIERGVEKLQVLSARRLDPASVATCEEIRTELQKEDPDMEKVATQLQGVVAKSPKAEVQKALSSEILTSVKNVATTSASIERVSAHVAELQSVVPAAAPTKAEKAAAPPKAEKAAALRQEIGETLKGVIGDAYKKDGFEQSLGYWRGADSLDNKNLRAIQNLNFENMSLADIQANVAKAEGLIHKGFLQMKQAAGRDIISQSPVPKTIDGKLEEVETKITQLRKAEKVKTVKEPEGVNYKKLALGLFAIAGGLLAGGYAAMRQQGPLALAAPTPNARNWLAEHATNPKDLAQLFVGVPTDQVKWALSEQGYDPDFQAQILREHNGLVGPLANLSRDIQRAAKEYYNNNVAPGLSYMEDLVESAGNQVGDLASQLQGLFTASKSAPSDAAGAVKQNTVGDLQFVGTATAIHEILTNSTLPLDPKTFENLALDTAYWIQHRNDPGFPPVLLGYPADAVAEAMKAADNVTNTGGRNGVSEAAKSAAKATLMAVQDQCPDTFAGRLARGISRAVEQRQEFEVQQAREFSQGMTQLSQGLVSLWNSAVEKASTLSSQALKSLAKQQKITPKFVQQFNTTNHCSLDEEQMCALRDAMQARPTSVFEAMYRRIPHFDLTGLQVFNPNQFEISNPFDTYMDWFRHGGPVAESPVDQLELNSGYYCMLGEVQGNVSSAIINQVEAQCPANLLKGMSEAEKTCHLRGIADLLAHEVCEKGDEVTVDNLLAVIPQISPFQVSIGTNTQSVRSFLQGMLKLAKLQLPVAQQNVSRAFADDPDRFGLVVYQQQ